MSRPALPPLNPLPPWQWRGLLGAGGLLLLTGIAWLAVHYGIGAGAGQLPHPLEPWAMRLHGAVAFAALFLLGALSAAHIPRGWRLQHLPRTRGQRTSGIALCALAAVLAATGYVLYYFATESLRPALGWAHAAAGLAMVPLLLQHRRPAR